jgi:hypothetical protein
MTASRIVVAAAICFVLTLTVIFLARPPLATSERGTTLRTAIEYVTQACAPPQPDKPAPMEACAKAEDAAVHVARAYDFLSDAKIREIGLWSHEVITDIVFLLVVVAVGCGLYFSYLQVSVATPTQIKIGQSIEVSSQVVGIIVLFLSLLFFYLYIVRVYPVVTLSSNG